MEIVVTWENDRSRHRETIVIWDALPPVWRINPDRVRTEQELAGCPETFTCFACHEKRSSDELGGEYIERRFCKLCIPYITEFVANVMEAWETKQWGKKSLRHEAGDRICGF